MKRPSILMVAGVLCILVLGSLWLLDFRLMRSQTVGKHTLSTFSTGSQVPVANRAGAGVQLAVVGQGALAGTLRQTLAASLEAAPAFGKVTLLDAVPEQASGIGLIVEVDEQQMLWTPLFAKSASIARVTFAMDGNLSWRRDTTVAMQPGAGPWARGQFSVADVSWGLSSHPGYQRLLAESLAAEIVKGLADVVNGQA